MRPKTLRETVERAAASGAWEHHLRDFLDHFYAADGEVARQSAAIAEPPGWIGEAKADAFMGGAGEHLARRWGLPIPAWVREEARYLDTALFVPDEPNLRGYLIGVSPVAFRVRLIFTGPDPLQRARFPYHRGVIRPPMTYPPAASAEP
jgi:hypothetical protein